MSEKSKLLALDFINNEKQFHLGFLPTEPPPPVDETTEFIVQDDTEPEPVG